MPIIVGRYSSSVDDTATVRVDASTSSLQTIDYSHHEVHSGSHFFVTGTHDPLADEANLDFLWVTPNTTRWPHALWEVEAEGECLMSLYEAVTTSADGTGITVFNNNRNSSTTATVAAYSGPTLAGGALGDAGQGGTLVWQQTIGSGKKVGGGSSRAHEFIGKQNTKYWFRITNNSGSDSWVNYDFFWYEHSDHNS